jgi:cytoskeletal protein RodZ
VTEPNAEDKERDREIAKNESVRQTIGDIRVSVWAIAVAVVIALAAIGWVLVNNQ